MPAFDDVVGVVAALACVGAVLWARRGARKKWSDQYAKGQADAQASARSAASVVIGDVTYGRNGVVAARHDGSTDNGTRADYDRCPDEYDALPEPMRRTGLVSGVGVMPNLGVSPAIGELSGPVPVGAGRPRHGTTRVVRASWSGRRVSSDDR